MLFDNTLNWPSYCYILFPHSDGTKFKKAEEELLNSVLNRVLNIWRPEKNIHNGKFAIECKGISLWFGNRATTWKWNMFSGCE